ncbi:MAG: ornithine cyclodeaminase [Alphaproteobacteria bacterium]|nr:MAG: ornithine cyclodeaminase [Alphaproteobacteria bacterium]
MRIVTAEETHRLLDYPSLVEALRELFRRGVDRAERFALEQPLPDGRRNDWLLLPAWQFGRHMGVKLVSVYPENQARGIDSVQGLYLLFDGTTGLPLAAIDGAALTLRKTAANSALAATWLAREDAGTLVMLGAGALGPHLVRAHCAVRPIRRVRIWNRTAARAEAAAAELRDELGLDVAPTADPEAAIRAADIVSCATMATEPLVKGAWLAPGTHVDLVGGFREDMREADDEAVRRARIFVDARFTATRAGDISQPLASGLVTDADIADSFELARGLKPGRRSPDEITLFKSGGGGHEDLGTAQHLMAKISAA